MNRWQQAIRARSVSLITTSSSMCLSMTSADPADVMSRFGTLMERAEVMTTLRSGGEDLFPARFEERVSDNAKKVSKPRCCLLCARSVLRLSRPSFVGFSFVPCCSILVAPGVDTSCSDLLSSFRPGFDFSLLDLSRPRPSCFLRTLFCVVFVFVLFFLFFHSSFISYFSIPSFFLFLFLFFCILALFISDFYNIFIPGFRCSCTTFSRVVLVDVMSAWTRGYCGLVRCD